MIRIFIAMILAVMSTCAMARWFPISFSDTDVLYIDPETLIKDGSFRRIWHLTDLNKPADGVLSMRSLVEYDCKEKRARTLELLAYSGSMGGGEVLAKIPANDWHYLRVDGPGDVVLRALCRQ